MAEPTNIISLASRRSKMVDSHDFFARRESLRFNAEEICVEQVEGEGLTDGECTFTLTLEGLKHFKKLFEAYGIPLEQLRTYRELRGCYDYVFLLASELDRWYHAEPDRLAAHRTRVKKKDIQSYQVIEALFARDIAEAFRLHAQFGTVAAAAKKFDEKENV